MSECVCGSSTERPNPDCERCQLVSQRDMLLAACKAAQHVWEQGCVDRGWKDDPNWIDEAKDLIDAAIAAAEGGGE